jgi:hypothetical protein
MIYKISTTGIVDEIVLYDLGERVLSHPTIELDLGLEYSEDELNSSSDLRNALSNSWIVVEQEESINDSKYYRIEDVNSIVSNIHHSDLKDLDNDKHKYLSNILSTGILKGGRLSINEEDGSKFDVEEGIGIIVDNYSDPSNPIRKIVTWPTTSGVTCDYLHDYEWSSICVVKNTPGNGVGSFFQVAERTLSDDERRDGITLGYVTHISEDSISYIESEACLVTDTMSQLWDFVYNFGPFNIEGNDYSCSSGLHIKKTGGKTYDSGTNYVNSNKSPNVFVSEDEDPIGEILYYFRDGVDNWVNNDIPVSIIDPDMYDSGEGLLPVTTSGWTIQTLFFYAPWNATEIQYGQKIYASKEEAIAGTNDLISINPWIGTYDTFRGWLIVRQGVSELNCSEGSMFISAGKLGIASTAAGGGASGEVNVTENYGITGVGVVLPKSGAVLPFKSISSVDQIVKVENNDTTKSVDISIDESKISHSSLSNLGNDDHTQYHNDTRGDVRYYTKTSLDSGQLDNRYYTKINTVSGVLDNKMLYADGSKQLTDDWDAGEKSIKAGGFYLNDAKFDAAIYSCATGALTGGSVSKCPEDETKIHIEAGTSLYVDMTDRDDPIIEILSWDDEHFYPAISGVDTKWVGIERTAPGVGSVVVSNKFSQLEKRYITILGRCWNFSGTDVIEGTGNYKAGAFNNAKTIQDLSYALGTINIYGNKYYATVSGTMKLSKTHGEAFRFSANYSNSEISPNIYESLTEIDIDYYTYNIFGTNAVQTTDIDCDYYDNDGVRTIVPTDKWTIQRIYYYPVSSITSVVYGQHIYDTYEDAYKNMFTEDVNLNRGTMEGTTFRAYLIIKQGCDDLTDRTKANIFEASSIGAGGVGSGGGIGGVTNHGALDGLGNDDHTQYILHNGTRNFSGPVKYSYQPTFNNDEQIITKKYVDELVKPFTNNHGELNGLGNDDHTQYLNQSRGDNRYYTKSEITTISGNIASKIITSHSGLSGLNNDDHTHYLLSNGTRDLSGVLKYSTGPTFDDNNQLVNKKYVDDKVIFGGQVTNVYSSEGSSTTSTTFQDKLSLTTSSMAGVYRLGYSMEYNASQSNRAVEVRVYNSTDDVIINLNNMQTNSSTNWFTLSGFYYLTIVSSSKTIKLQYRYVTGTCVVREARLEIWRVS